MMVAVVRPKHSFAPAFLLASVCWAQGGGAGAYEKAIEQAKELHARGDLPGVVRLLKPWAESSPERAEAQHLLGLACYQQQDLGAAIRHLSAALKLEPENSPAAQQTAEALGMAYYFSNRAADAVPLLEKVTARKPADTYYKYALAMAYAYTRNLDAARRTFAGLFGVPPDSPQAFLLASHFLARENLAAEAEHLIREAQSKRPDLPDLHYRLGMLALTNGALPEAVQHLQKELAVNPLHQMAWHYLGDVYLRQGKVSEAIPCLQRSIWLNVRAAESYVLIAGAYTEQGDLAQAEQALKRAVELAPQSYEAHFALARVYHKTSRPELAKQEMSIAGRLRPDNAPKELK